METRVLTWPVSAGVAGEWDTLADATEASPFVRPGWVDAWWRAFGRGRLEVVAVRDGADLAAMIPMVRNPLGVSSPTNWHTPRFGVVARDEPAAVAAARALFARRPGRVALSFLLRDDPFMGVVRAAAGHAGYRMEERTLARPYVVDLDGDWGAYRRGRLGKQLLGKLGRTRRRLEDTGAVTFEMSDGGGERLGAVLADVFRVEASGWKGAAGTAIDSRPETRRFYSDVARWARDRGALRIPMLRLDGELVAAEIALHDRGRHLGLKAGFDERFARFGPGMLLLYEIIREDFERGLGTFDFLGDEADWKARWSTGRYELIRLQAFAPTPLGRAQLAAHRYGRPAVQRLRETADGIRARLRPRS